MHDRAAFRLVLALAVLKLLQKFSAVNSERLGGFQSSIAHDQAARRLVLASAVLQSVLIAVNWSACNTSWLASAISVSTTSIMTIDIIRLIYSPFITIGELLARTDILSMKQCA